MSKSIWYLGGSAQSYDGRLGQYAVIEMMKARSKEPLDFTYIDGQSTYLSPTIIDQINASADLLIVGNGGFIKNNEAQGLVYNISLQNIWQIKVPIVGFSIEDFNKYNDFSPEMHKALKAFLNKAKLFSVGYSSTLDQLDKQGFDTEKISVVPDPTIFMKAAPVTDKIFDSGALKIGVNWDNQDFKALYGAVRNLTSHYGGKIYLVEHDTETELNKWNKLHTRNIIADDLSECKYSILYKDLYNELYPPSDHSAPLMADVYRKMDLIIGSCPYSAMLALGQNVPFIGISQGKYLQHFTLDAQMECLRYVDEDMIMRGVDEVISNPQATKEKLESTKAQFQYSTEWFIDQILVL